MEQLEKKIDKLMETNIIESATSQYCSLTWILLEQENKERNKRWRLVTDFRQLHEITLGSYNPLPFTRSIVKKLETSNYILIMVLKMSFFQNEMDPKSIRMTANTR
jgi:hypothetical protein